MRRSTAILVWFAALMVVPTVGFTQESEQSSDEADATRSEADLDEAERRLEQKLEEESEVEQGSKLATLSTGLQPAVTGEALAERRKLEKIREKLDQEPGIDEVQEAALEFYGIEAGRIAKYSNQASTKSLAPKVSVQYRRNMIDTAIRQRDFIQFGDQLAARDNVSGNVDEVTVSGTWNLPKLIYNPEKLELASLRKLRERVLKEVTRLYYLRRRLKIGYMLNPPEDASTRARKQIRIQQTTAMINAITDGVFENTEVEELDD